MRSTPFLVLASVSAAFATSADAADIMPVAAPPPAAGVELPLFTWTGGYVGLQGGYAWGDASFDPGTGSLDASPDGGMFGGYAGYNWQIGQVVLGVEGDVNAVWNDETVSVPGGSVELETDYLASIRGRLGYAWDRVMLYGTGGVAFTDASATTTINGQNFDMSDTLTGWTVGAGIDYALTDNWVGRVEYRYYDFSNEDFGDLSNVDLNFNTVSVGISYKF